ncbi:unnamed protein product [Brassicogethes aeneus]|uniref:Uncharacterized protein n=1 Tax=Brassicogethes aeneus TaxID=1431903 RepID=A0A9P0FL56_BRAAE|nr:unnamed protein product [Brassicogethes aeneus]
MAWATATKYVREAKPLASIQPRTILSRLMKLCKAMKGLKKVVDYNTAQCLVLAVVKPSRNTKKKRQSKNRRTPLSRSKMNRGTQRGFRGPRGAHSDPQQHNRQYADAEAQYQTYEPQPRQDYREYENTRRGRGRTGGNRSKKTPVSQPLQKATAPPPSGPPAPTRLSKASSTPKNDPIYHEALMPEPGQEGRPLADTLKNFPSFKAYYVACHALARMYKIKDKNGIVLTFNERSYMDSVYGLHGSLPQLISTYLSGFGNITSESGREYKCSFRRLEYVPGPDHMHGGWFGQIDQDNHFMYMEYPCLAVFAERIIRDYGFTVHQDARDWDLPDGIRPDADWNAGLPTPNLLGRSKMNRGTQRGFRGPRGAHSDPQQHNRQYADAEAQYQTYEPQPRQDYREYENTRRGRGRTGGNRSKKTPVSQPLQKATAPPPSGPPAPTRLSKASSTPKNDPIYHEALMPEPGQEGRPLADTLKNFPSFKAYYVACHALARMYKIKDKNGIVLTFNERSYMDSVYGLHGSLPQLISTYLSGFGNITSESGREYKCSFRRLEYVPGPDHMHGGWFGQIDQDNHFMYMEYPCLAVFAERIIRDYGFTVHQDARDWDLPDEKANDDTHKVDDQKNRNPSGKIYPSIQEKIVQIQKSGRKTNTDLENRLTKESTRLAVLVDNLTKQLAAQTDLLTRQSGQIEQLQIQLAQLLANQHAQLEPTNDDESYKVTNKRKRVGSSPTKPKEPLAAPRLGYSPP